MTDTVGMELWIVGPIDELFGAGSGDAQRQADFIGNLVLVLTFLDVEILTVDGEAGADDQQIALETRHAGAQFILEIGELHGRGDVLGDAMQRERAGDIGGGHVALGFHIGERFRFKGDFRILGDIQPFVAVQMGLLHRVGHGHGLAGHDDLAGRSAGIFRVKAHGAADAAGAAVDGFQRRVEFEDDVVHALRVFEVKALRRGASSGGKADEWNEMI